VHNWTLAFGAHTHFVLPCRARCELIAKQGISTHLQILLLLLFFLIQKQRKIIYFTKKKTKNVGMSQLSFRKTNNDVYID
jgi:hypothetical protein